MKIRVFFLLWIGTFFFSCSEKNITPSKEYELIAHAGGAIDGYIYTNSKEAMETAVANGYRYIEFDFLMTSDSVLVAAHSWRDFNEMSGYPHFGDSVPALKDFLDRRIYGRYTPLTAQDINVFFEENEHLFLVTDKISDAALLDSCFPTLKNRMVVEAFNYDDYNILHEKGYYRVMYSCMASDLETSIVKHLLLYPFFSGRRIEWITLHTSAFDNDFFKLADALCDYKSAVFTVNDTAAIPFAYRDKTDMIYTDSIMP